VIYNNIFTNKPTAPTSRLRCETDDFDISQSCLETMLILEEEYFDINKNHIQVTHLSMKEQSLEILTEGFGDFIDSVIRFFKNLMKRFTEFMKKVFMIINAYLGDFDAFLTKYKDHLQKLDPDFTIKGYDYVFQDSIPRLDKIDAIISDYNSELEQLDGKKKGDIIKEKDKYVASTQMNKLRAYVLGMSGEIEEDEFVKTARKLYRKGEDEETDIEVKKSYLTKIINDYPHTKKLYNDAVKERDKVMALIDSMKLFFEKSASVYYKGNNKTIGMNKIEKKESGYGIKNTGNKVEKNYAFSDLEKINTFYNFKFTQAKELGNICVTAMVEKVNALKEALKLYRVIVRKSMTHKKEEEKKEN